MIPIFNFAQNRQIQEIILGQLHEDVLGHPLEFRDLLGLKRELRG